VQANVQVVGGELQSKPEKRSEQTVQEKKKKKKGERSGVEVGVREQTNRAKDRWVGTQLE
jgi:hypothetical protein